jgi:hypothetical protein
MSLWKDKKNSSIAPKFQRDKQNIQTWVATEISALFRRMAIDPPPLTCLLFFAPKFKSYKKGFFEMEMKKKL